MIDFACRRFSLEEVIRCGLSLTKADFRILSLFMKEKKSLTSGEIEKSLGLERSTVQRALKKLYEKQILMRSQLNLPSGGYNFYYSVKSKKEIKSLVSSIVGKWVKRVESELGDW